MENQESKEYRYITLILHGIIWLAVLAVWTITTMNRTDLKEQYTVNIRARDQIILSYRDVITSSWMSCKEEWTEEPAKVRCVQKSSSKITKLPNSSGSGEFGQGEQ